MRGEDPREAFWSFSWRAYGREGAAAACLALQGRHGIDVNVLLYCAWVGRRGRSVDGEELRLILNRVGLWQDAIVKPLRAVRSTLKGMETPGAAPEAVASLRQGVKDLELEAERLEQHALAARETVADSLVSPGRAAGSMARYLVRCGARLEPRDQEDLAVVLRACFPELSRLEAAWVVAVSPQRLTRPVSRSKRSRTRPTE